MANPTTRLAHIDIYEDEDLGQILKWIAKPLKVLGVRVIGKKLDPEDPESPVRVYFAGRVHKVPRQGPRE